MKLEWKTGRKTQLDRSTIISRRAAASAGRGRLWCYLSPADVSEAAFIALSPRRERDTI